MKNIMFTSLVSIICLVLNVHAAPTQWSVSDGGNGHYFEVVSVPEGITWVDANSVAETRGGYLATILSQSENDFIFNLADNDVYWKDQTASSTIGPWLGGYQLPGSVEPDSGWAWITGESFIFTNWDSSGPDNQGGNQDYLHFGYTIPRNGKWNDLENDGRLAIAFIIEFTPKTIYVDDSATGNNDGSNWADAFTSLQDALLAASYGDEILIAQGIYRPDIGTGITLGDRETAFNLKHGVVVKGGYAGNGGTDPNERDTTVFQTILSGDLEGNDTIVTNASELLVEPSRAENSFHIIYGFGLSEKTVLDGLYVIGGNANGQSSNAWGGGISLNESSPVIKDCVITGNTGKEGNGITCDVGSSPRIENSEISGNSALWIGAGINCWWSSNPTLIGCEIIDNWTDGDGAGMYNAEGSCPVIQDTIFERNTAIDDGGGMFNKDSSPELFQCSFTDNHAHWGGGMYNEGNCQTKVIESAFAGNTGAEDDGAGGGVLNSGCQATFIDCTFRDNSARWGGGMCNPHGGQSVVMNCLFESNSAFNSAGMENWEEAHTIIESCVFKDNVASNWCGGVSCGVDTPAEVYCTPSITNCLFVGNRADNSNSGAIGVHTNGKPTIINCTIYGNVSNNNGAVTCHVSAEPEILNSIFWANSSGGVINESTQVFFNNGLSGLINNSCVQGWTGLLGGIGNIGTNPEFGDVDNSDFHLKSESGRWSKISENWVFDNITSPCIDTGDMNTPIGLEPFPNGGVVNMGSYGGTVEASKSYFGTTPCETPIAGDINGDCRVDLIDFSIMAFHWLEDNN